VAGFGLLFDVRAFSYEGVDAPPSETAAIGLALVAGEVDIIPIERFQPFKRRIADIRRPWAFVAGPTRKLCFSLLFETFETFEARIVLPLAPVAFFVDDLCRQPPMPRDKGRVEPLPRDRPPGKVHIDTDDAADRKTHGLSSWSKSSSMTWWLAPAAGP
jgi:hypothetical protein